MMEKHIKVGVGVMIIHDNQILMGHRNAHYEDTGVHPASRTARPPRPCRRVPRIFEVRLRSRRKQVPRAVDKVPGNGPESLLPVPVQSAAIGRTRCIPGKAGSCILRTSQKVGKFPVPRWRCGMCLS